MAIDELLGVIAAFAFFAFLIYLPIRFFILIGQVKSLERRFMTLADRMPITPSAKPSEPAVPAPVAPVAVPVVAPAAVPVPPVAPPPLPARTVSTAPARVLPDPEPDPLFARLRDLGLLPPADLNGEYALGAWWAVRVGGLLAVAAVVFLGIWLNLRSTIPPFVRVLEVALVGAGLFWGGVRLSAQRKDLGEVLAAAGLAVWQFAAWATYGLDKMRLFEGPAQAALVQFIVAAVVAALALWRGSKLFGQLAVVFAAVAVYFSIGIGTEPWPTAIGAGLVALLGVILMVRGPWGSAGVLGLVGSQACLLFLYDAMPTKDANYLSLQLAALGSFLALWVGERLVKDDAVLLGRDARSAFQLASFFAPAFLSLFLATGGEHDRATVALLIAAVAAIVGYVEQLRNRLVSEVLLLAAVGFVGAGLAWLVDPHLVWLIWALAAGATLVVGTRTRSELVRWASEALAGVAVYAFLDHPPAQPWMGLAGIGVLGAMLAFREDWERVTGWQEFRRVVGILGLAFAALSVQDQLPRADSGWPWLVLLMVAALRFRPALVWAAAPCFVFTAFVTVFQRTPSTWAAFWAALVVVINVIGLWRLVGREGAGVTFLRHALAFVSAIVAFAFVQQTASLLLVPQAETASAYWHAYPRWMVVVPWSVGGALLAALAVGLRRLGVRPSDLSFFAAGALFGHFVQAFASWTVVQSVGLAQTPLVLLGLACLLHVLVVNTKEQGVWGTVQRACLGGVMLFVVVFDLFWKLPGAGVSLFWALASMLTFVVGHLLATRSLRMLGLLGLVAATFRVLSHDITDLLGRIAACGAMAVAFFGIAWLYGRITSDQRNG